MNTNLFYFNTLNSIGGIETFFWQLAKKYGEDHDITILYRRGDPAQIARLSKLVRVRKYHDGERVRCKRAFCAFNTDILDFIDADEYWQMLHGDYKKLGVMPQKHEKLQEYIACSEVVRDAYADVTGKVAHVCYNPFTPEKPRKVLRLVSATRLTPDKGWNRMLVLSDELGKAGIPFAWDVYTDQNKTVSNPNIRLCQPRLDILDFIADADYFVQLSDAEGYCYSVVEALSVGTPVIVTDFPVAKEIGVENGVNGFIIPMDMSKLPLKEIYNGLKKFKYTPKADRWGEYLLPSPPDFEQQLNKPVTVKSKKLYYDMEFQRLVEPGEEWKCPIARAEMLYDIGVIEAFEE